MNSIKKSIPNILTLLNLLCGCMALLSLVKTDFEMAFGWVLLGIFFDFFDGFFARILKVSSLLGLQLDSLADMVTSGVVPGYTMYLMILKSNTYPEFAIVGFAITLASCYRLAKFNIDERQTIDFIGLPTPANCLFILSLPLIINKQSSLFMINLLSNSYLLFLIVALSSFLLNSNIKLFSLKFKQFQLQTHWVQLCFLGFSLLLIPFLGITALPLIILIYILLSLIKNHFFSF
jgi:CDP-diacylglycerol---serine O-phosphatidyltransferase